MIRSATSAQKSSTNSSRRWRANVFTSSSGSLSSERTPAVLWNIYIYLVMCSHWGNNADSSKILLQNLSSFLNQLTSWSEIWTDRHCVHSPKVVPIYRSSVLRGHSLIFHSTACIPNSTQHNAHGRVRVHVVQGNGRGHRHGFNRGDVIAVL